MPRTYVSLIQTDYGRSRHGTFEAVLVQGEQLWHWFRDNSRNDFGPWFRGPRITGERDNVTGPGCLINPASAPDHTATPRGNFEVLPDECRGSVVHYWHPNVHVEESWIRTDCFDVLEPHPRLANRAQKIAQLTGEFDREAGMERERQDMLSTAPRAGSTLSALILAPLSHQGRICFLFGDTWRVGHSAPNDDLDAIAFCTDTNADDGASN